MVRLIAAASFFAVLFLAGVAESADRFAVITFYNRLDTPKKYSFRWEGGEWDTENVVQPGQGKWHSKKVPQGGNVPRAEIRFDSDLKDSKSVLKYTLEAEGAPAQGDQFGEPYKFVYDGTKRYVDLKKGK